MIRLTGNRFSEDGNLANVLINGRWGVSHRELQKPRCILDCPPSRSFVLSVGPFEVGARKLLGL